MTLSEQNFSDFLKKVNIDSFLDECESHFPLFSEMAGHSGYDIENKESLASFLEVLNDIRNVGVAGVSPCGFTYDNEISNFHLTNKETIDKILRILAEQDEAFGQYIAQDDSDENKVYIALEYGAGSLMGTDLENFEHCFVETPSLEDMIEAIEDGDNEFVLNFLDEYEHNGWNENDFIQLRQSAEYCENEEILDAIDSSGLIPEEYYDNVRTM